MTIMKKQVKFMLQEDKLNSFNEVLNNTKLTKQAVLERAVELFIEKNKDKEAKIF